MTPSPRLTPLLLACWLCAACAPRPRTLVYDGRAFIFAFEQGGACQLRLGPDRFNAPPGTHAIWEIRNECAVAIEPELHDFRFEGSLEKGAPAARTAHPFDLSGIFQSGEPSRLVEARGSGEIKLRVRKDARPGRYQYSFRDLKAAAPPQDPKIDIWPPI